MRKYNIAAAVALVYFREACLRQFGGAARSRWFTAARRAKTTGNRRHVGLIFVDFTITVAHRKLPCQTILLKNLVISGHVHFLKTSLGVFFTRQRINMTVFFQSSTMPSSPPPFKEGEHQGNAIAPL